MKISLKTPIVVIVFLSFVTPLSAIESPIDDTPPNITILFAGNLSDSGGPFWLPPGESICLTGEFENGYYTNDSRQSEDWIYINVTVTDDDGVDVVRLCWYDATDDTWINDSYPFINTGGDFWEFNSSGNITDIIPGHDYSFDIFAKDTIGNSKYISWMKTGLGGETTRRYVQLGCMPTNITYKPFYLRSHTSETGTYEYDDCNSKDRLHHDQGPNGTYSDTGYLSSTLPGEMAEERWCSIFTGYWFEDSVCIEPFTLTNMYYHFWYHAEQGDLPIAGWSKTRDSLSVETVDFYDPLENDNRSTITYNDRNYYLNPHLLQTTPTIFTENDIYELFTLFNIHTGVDLGPSPLSIGLRTITNRSFLSFVLFNIPDNETLNASYYESDDDGLSDWTELYVTYTHPFLVDTDYDGATDYEEVNGESHGYWDSDPNNCTNTTDYRRVDAGGPYAGLISEFVQFTGSAFSGFPPYSWYWDFGDGTNGTGNITTHTYSSLGTYTVTLTVVDSESYSDFDTATATIGALLVNIMKPEKAIYINNKKIIPFLIPLIIGGIDLEVDATDDIYDISLVEFCIDGQLKATCNEEPYSWTWNERTPLRFRHVIKTIAYDNAGNIASDEILVWKFF